MKKWITSVVCAGVLAISAPAWANLITNPGFEVGGAYSTTGWNNTTDVVEDLGVGFGGSNHAAHVVGTPSDLGDFFHQTVNWSGYSDDTYEVSFDIATQHDPDAETGGFGSYVFIKFGSLTSSSARQINLSVSRAGEVRVFDQTPAINTWVVLTGSIIEPSDFNDLENALNEYRFRLLFDRSGGSTSYVIQVLSEDSVLFTSDSLTHFQRSNGTNPGTALPTTLIVTRQSSANSFAVDNFYAGEVIPEPAGLAMLGLACAAGLLRRRRQTLV